MAGITLQIKEAGVQDTGNTMPRSEGVIRAEVSWLPGCAECDGMGRIMSYTLVQHHGAVRDRATDLMAGTRCQGPGSGIRWLTACLTDTTPHSMYW